MPPKGTKRTTKKVVDETATSEGVSPTSSTSPVPSEPVQNVSSQEETVITEQQSWSAQVEEETKKPEEPVKKSCTDFERTEVRGWETKTVNELNNSDLLKVLMTRGEDTQNPALVVGTRHLLMQLHMERVPRTVVPEDKPHIRPRHNNRRNYHDFEDRPPRQVGDRDDRPPRMNNEERDGGNREGRGNGNRRWNNESRQQPPRGGRGQRVQLF